MYIFIIYDIIYKYVYVCNSVYNCYKIHQQSDLGTSVIIEKDPIDLLMITRYVQILSERKNTHYYSFLCLLPLQNDQNLSSIS